MTDLNFVHIPSPSKVNILHPLSEESKLSQPVMAEEKSCPKISIVTPSFNSSRYISETIQSVISQSGDFSIEYFVVDKCSTDGTNLIVEKFQRLLNDDRFPLACNGVDLHFVSEDDDGMYDAINKGFEKASGDIFAWLNADDIYLPGALATITRVFANYQDVHWVKGITSYINEDSFIWQMGSILIYSKDWIKAGIYGRDNYFIQQDSVFWRAWLWEKCGGFDLSYKRAGDYCLWIRFAELTPLVSIKSWISCFRRVEGQISQDHAAYMKEVSHFSPGNDVLSRKVRLFTGLEMLLPRFIRPAIFRLLFGRPVFPTVLINSDSKFKMITGEYYDVINQIPHEN